MTHGAYSVKLKSPKITLLLEETSVYIICMYLIIILPRTRYMYACHILKTVTTVNKILGVIINIATCISVQQTAW